MKNILVIKSHPREKSFCNALTDEYIKGAKKSGHKVKELNLKNFNLERYLKFKQNKILKLPQGLLKSQDLIKWSNHLVFSYPTWWGTPPALLKLFIEIIFQSGFAFKYNLNSNKVYVEKKLIGKSARLIVTMDAPPIYNKIIYGDPGGKMMKRVILNFCGVKPVKKNYFGSVKLSTENKRKKWLNKMYNIGLKEFVADYEFRICDKCKIMKKKKKII